jgi:hypothetical protein
MESPRRKRSTDSSLKVLFRTFLLLLAAIPVAAIALVVLCFEDRPLVVRDVQLTAQDVEKAKRILDEHEARRAGPGGLRTVTIDQKDLDVALNYMANRWGRGAVNVVLQPGVASLQATVEFPRSPIGRYVNVDATVRETATLPRFLHLTIGRVRVPAALGDLALDEALRRVRATDRGALAAGVVKGIGVGAGRLDVTYAWSDAAAERARAVLVAPEDQARLALYQERLAREVAGAPKKVSLATLMPPLFLLALDRGSTGDVVRENRAAILVLAFYANGRGLGDLVAAARQWPQPARRIS